jgi:uncharacterized protein YkwD
LLLALAACGGGGGVAAAPAPALPAAASPPASPPATGSTCGLPDFAASALARINQYRAAGANCRTEGVFAPASALVWNGKLTQSADAHSQDMAAKNYFSHTSADGRTLGVRISATGYSWSSAGENIAAGYDTVNIVIDGWMASDGHCANIMDPNFTEFGLACVARPPGTTTEFANYWTMDLARPR